MYGIPVTTVVTILNYDLIYSNSLMRLSRLFFKNIMYKKYETEMMLTHEYCNVKNNNYNSCKSIHYDTKNLH